MKKLFFLAILLIFGGLVACGDTVTHVHLPPTDGGGVPPAANIAPSPRETPAPRPVRENLTPAEIFEENRHAIFRVAYPDAFGGYWAFGSGFFIDSTGIAVTNHHVMIGTEGAVAVLYDGTMLDILGYFSYDFDNDLAIIQVDNSGRARFDYLSMGNSDVSRVGEGVFAVGGPGGEPITFTPGMISRIAAEPISFDGYTVSGMLQHTAAIYGGNSGGPLLNEYGQVIGINTAGRLDRASVQWAVPINRVEMPRSGSTLNRLPMGAPATQLPVFDGRIFYLTQFPTIPDFLSVSRNASLIMSGTPRDLGETSGIIYELYDFLFIYNIGAHQWIPDTDEFDRELERRGFIFQNVVHFNQEVWVYLFHPGQNLSVSYAFFHGLDLLQIAIGSGDVYTIFYHSDTPVVPDFPTDFVPAGSQQFVGEWVNRNVLTNLGYGYHTYDVYMWIFADGTGVMEYEWVVNRNWFRDLDIAWSAADGVFTVFVPEAGLRIDTTYTFAGNTMTLVDDTGFVEIWQRLQ